MRAVDGRVQRSLLKSIGNPIDGGMHAGIFCEDSVPGPGAFGYSAISTTAAGSEVKNSPKAFSIENYPHPLNRPAASAWMIKEKGIVNLKVHDLDAKRRHCFAV